MIELVWQNGAMRYFLLLLCQPLIALTIASNLNEAKAGDYLVTAINRTYTVLVVKEVKSNGDLVFEEISIPARSRRRYNDQWADWVAKGAPGHSAWTTYTIDPKSGELSESYSRTKGGWVEIDDHFLSTLMTLRFQPLPRSERKILGARRTKRSKLWNPPLTFEGERIQGVPFDAHKAQWPRDGSPLAGKWVTIYTPAEKGPYPGHFPYWIEVTPLMAENRVRVVDSGTGLCTD